MQVLDVEVAKAIIAHEAVECFLGKEQPGSAQPGRLVSCTGGIFWGRAGEQWPRSPAGRPLIPWLQILCADVERRYPFFQRGAVCFYLDEDFKGFEAVSQQDASEFVVREYAIGEKLRPLTRPRGLGRHRFHRVVWKKSQDYPPL